MPLLCLLQHHRPSRPSIKRGKDGELEALCDACGVPLTRPDGGRWRAREPLYDERGRA